MAHYFLFPEKDTTIFSHPTRAILNTGIDEVLTIQDEESNTDLNFYPSRILIQFKQSEINDVLQNKVQSGLFSASLNLFQTEHRELSVDQNLEVYPQATTNDSFGSKWPTASADIPLGATASFIKASPGGGVWYTGSGFEVDRTYGYNDDLDLSFNITSPLLKHTSSSLFSDTYPNGITNNGFLIKRSDSQEFTAIDDGELNFFSMDTHTIFPPFLDISWDDSIYDTGSATNDKVKSTGECYVTLRNNKEKFRTSEEYKFRLNVRDLYPTRKFTTTSNFLDVKYFTSRSFYSLVDYATEEVLIPFGEESKLSADAEGMHFKIYMNGLQEERYYKLLFKHENNDGIQVYDDNYYFKVVKT
jgi:hypothetical protein